MLTNATAVTENHRNAVRFIPWLSLFWISLHTCDGQNLIPNPGFEEVFTLNEYQWVQPQGPYYHYEATDSLTQHRARTGEFVNGLCMYNNRENEYLHVKLLEPLEEGMTYRLRFHARLMKAKCFNHQLQTLIGVHFGNRALDTHVPGDLYLRPQLNLELPDENRFDWFELTGTYTAAGGEAFMTLGYFAATQSEELRRAEDTWKKPIKTDKQEEEDKSWLYLPPDEQKKYIKAQKKKARKSKGKEEIPDFSKPESDPVTYPETGYDSDVRFFQVRYYFDDFCLLPDTGQGDCSPATPPEKLEKGGTVLLKNVFFETDEAVLRDESLIQLRALKNLMDIHESMVIEVRGYTDDRGEEHYNLELSERRAEAVTDWLHTEGIAPERLSARGFGEKHPIATNNSEAGRTKNRRVEFLIVDM